MRYRHLHLVVNSLLVIATFWCALPATIAIFPQMSAIDVCDVEAEIAANTKATQLFYNKGL